MKLRKNIRHKAKIYTFKYLTHFELFLRFLRSFLKLYVGLPVLYPQGPEKPDIFVITMSYNLLLRSSTSLLLRISLANSAAMKTNQFVRSFSFFTLLTLNRIWNVDGAVNCTEMTTKQRFTHMLGVTERGQCACPKRFINTKITPEPPKDPTTVNIEELQTMIAAGSIQLFDVREPYELQESGKIEQAINIPRKLLKIDVFFPLSWLTCKEMIQHL